MDRSCLSLSLEKLERVREIDHLLTQERLFLAQAASRAYHGTPLATDPVNILHPNNTFFDVLSVSSTFGVLLSMAPTFANGTNRMLAGALY
ncbi:hypothetical protein MJO29_012436 [Puccinia striiformis f. sp. tritici]|nr:hypothetical protein MJO29_012436 [Puccinia striiformis f. sp. tritici]